MVVVNVPLSVNAVYCAVDYDSPVAENGDLTEKYFIIQKVLRETLPNSEGMHCFVGVLVDGSNNKKVSFSALSF